MDSNTLEYYERLRSGLALSDYTVNYALLIHEKVLKNNFSRGNLPSVIASACIYIASKHSENFRTLKAVSNIGNAERKDIARCYRLFLKNHEEIGFVKPLKKRSPRYGE